MTFMDSWVYFVQVEATIRFIGMYGFSQLFKFFFFNRMHLQGINVSGWLKPSESLRCFMVY